MTQHASRCLLLFCSLLGAQLPAHAETLSKLLEVKRGEVSKLSVAGLNHGRSGLFALAVRDGDGNLRVQAWAAGETEPRAVVVAGAVKEVDTAVLSDKRFVTAVRDGADRLRVIAWRASPDGRRIDRLGTAVDRRGPGIRTVAAATSTQSSDHVFVAARDFDGNLIVRSYEIRAASVIEQGRARYGPVHTIAASTGVSQGTAMRDGDGKLRLIHFWTPLHRGGFGTGGRISDVRIASTAVAGFLGEWFTFSIGEGPTGVRTGAGCTHRRLIGHGLGKLIGWKLEENSILANFQRTREKQLTGFGGIAKKADLVSLDGPGLLVTGHLGFGNFCRLLARDQGKPRLQLTVWDTRDRDNAFVKLGDAHLGGDYTEIEMTQVRSSGDQQRLVVALRGVRGELKVTLWGINP